MICKGNYSCKWRGGIRNMSLFVMLLGWSKKHCLSMALKLCCWKPDAQKERPGLGWSYLCLITQGIVAVPYWIDLPRQVSNTNSCFSMPFKELLQSCKLVECLIPLYFKENRNLHCQVAWCSIFSLLFKSHWSMMKGRVFCGGQNDGLGYLPHLKIQDKISFWKQCSQIYGLIFSSLISSLTACPGSHPWVLCLWRAGQCLSPSTVVFANLLYCDCP